MKLTIEQTSKINRQGAQLFINIKKKFHEKLESDKLLGKDLRVTIILDDDIESS